MMIMPGNTERKELTSLARVEALISDQGDEISEKWLQGWQRLKGNYRDGDDVYLYASSQDAFDQGMGYTSIMLLRDDEMIDEVLVTMS